MAEVQLKNMDKIYPNGFKAVSDVSIDIADGEFLVLVGPSGSGKSTLLRMVAGLEDISGGDLLIGDNRVNDKEPKERDIAMVFQNYALYPHMTVADNIGFSLKLSGVPKDEIKRRVDDVAKILELEPQLEKKPSALSGGQRQRVAMGRAIVRQPAAFLMDEPLSNLDAKLRVQMRAEIAQLQTDLGVTTIYVTHDQVEAMTMGDRVAVLKDGLLQQCDTPQNLYDHPNNLFVAAFIGSPSMNLYQGQLEVNGDTGRVKIGSQTVDIPAERFERTPALRNVAGDVVVGIRPEDIEDAAVVRNPAEGQQIKLQVDLIEALGSELMVHGTIDAQLVDAGDPDAVDSRQKSTLVARFSPRSGARRGETLQAYVDAANFYFFDTSTGEAIR